MDSIVSSRWQAARIGFLTGEDFHSAGSAPSRLLPARDVTKHEVQPSWSCRERPRGYGRKFRYANYKDWGGGDYRDILSGVDHVIGMGVADPDRLGIMGWSYGGYMTVLGDNTDDQAFQGGICRRWRDEPTRASQEPKFIKDAMERNLEWFDRWIKGRSETSSANRLE